MSAALACAAACAIVGACADKPEAAAAGVPTVEVRAEVSSAQTATAFAMFDGRVSTVAVSEGAPVRAGDVVAVMTNASVERDFARARAQVALAEARLRAARQPAARPRLKADDAARERATAAILANREAKRARYRELFATHDVSKEELENAENEYAAALRDWLAERERATVTAAQTDATLLQLELEQAKAEEALATERKAQLNITAPIGGVVTRVPAHPGDTLFGRDPIVEIANNATVTVRGAIAPELVRYVHAGTTVEVKVFTVPPRKFSVPIRAVVPASGGATIVVDLPNPDSVLQAGQQALITVK
jgi:multidrug resistance efflux pump